MGTFNLSEDLWFEIGMDMENAWMFDESEDWMAPFFDLEWALDNWTGGDWDQLQMDYDDNCCFDMEDDTFYDFMVEFGYYGEADSSLWTMAG